MNTATAFAPAKINLFLAIRGRRSDGYHELDMVNVQASLGDYLTFEDRTEPGIEITCDDPNVPEGSENLVWRAAALLVGESPVPGLSITLEKRIPVGAGLGGGSSDASATLKTVNDLRQCGQDNRLVEFAARIGSDVPYFVVGGLCRCRGRGEQVQPLLLRDLTEPWLWALVFAPPVSVRTVDAYRWWDAEGEADSTSADPLIEAVRLRDAGLVSSAVHNSFDSVVPRFVGAVAEAKKAIETETGLEAHLCGSGASLFLVGGSRDELADIQEHLSHLPTLQEVRCGITGLVV
jgi:4-diphosphocytidyl-2-C-methyl-D-erythritol kinase